MLGEYALGIVEQAEVLQVGPEEPADEELGGEVVKVVFLMELAGLKGRERLKGYEVESVLCYDGK